MDIKIMTREVGKSFSSYIKLNSLLKRKVHCRVVTDSEERFLRDFKYATGNSVILESLDSNSNLYQVKLDRQY